MQKNQQAVFFVMVKTKSVLYNTSQAFLRGYIKMQIKGQQGRPIWGNPCVRRSRTIWAWKHHIWNNLKEAKLVNTYLPDGLRPAPRRSLRRRLPQIGRLCLPLIYILTHSLLTENICFLFLCLNKKTERTARFQTKSLSVPFLICFIPRLLS